MKIIETANAIELGRSAGRLAGQLIVAAIEKNGQANIILATGTSQFETIHQLIKEDVDWSKVIMFHLDEYIGLPESSPASFRKYLKERFLANVFPLKEVYLVDGETDPHVECGRLGAIIEKKTIDVALVGIGENGHLGFNDPPADFETNQPFIIVQLDENCRKQQFGEGWFPTMDDVPHRAITMSVKQIIKSKQIICSVPDLRKARAIKDCLEEPVSNSFPASILQLHENCTCYLDSASASLLTRENIKWEQNL
ncbi:MAG: glucosamine-6-phosphate deaminase [Ferruginibacter sp.]